MYCQAPSFVICEWSLCLWFVNYPQNCVRSKLLIARNQPAHRFGLGGVGGAFFFYAYLSHHACKSGILKTNAYLNSFAFVFTAVDFIKY